MFEYLMPMLVMPTYGNTLLAQAVQGAVQRQIQYGRQRGVPWGMSESGYNLTDAHLNYQYRAFGVPGLGLQRGLGEDLVVAPYATVLALMVDPAAAVQNLRRLAGEGAAGAFGFYEAVDYTPTRLRPGETRAIVRSYMAHHQGMSLLALAQVLQEKKFPTIVTTPSTDKYYRVQVGPYPDARSATAAKKELEKQGFKTMVRR